MSLNLYRDVIRTFVLIGVPVGALLLRARWLSSRASGRERGTPNSFWMALLVAILYCLSLPNLIYKWSPVYAFGWPLIGVLIALGGMAMAFRAPPKQRLVLLSVNALLVILSIVSVLSPN